MGDYSIYVFENLVFTFQIQYFYEISFCIWEPYETEVTVTEHKSLLSQQGGGRRLIVLQNLMMHSEELYSFTFGSRKATVRPFET